MVEANMDSQFISIRPAVEFTDMHDQYCYNEDLICSFKFNDYFPREGDRIAIFKLGWSFVKDYVVFEWAPTGHNNKNHTVTFNKHILPKNNVEIYQICYISGQNELHGASSSFQFSSEKNKDAKCISDQPAQIVDSSIATSTAIVPMDKQTDSEEVRKLKEENLLLRETLAMILTNKNVIENKQKYYEEEIETLKEKMNSMSLSLSQILEIKNLDNCTRSKEINKTFNKEIEDLKEKIITLESAFDLQQREIEMFKSKIIEGGEEYKKLYLEKMKLEKRIKQKSAKDETMENIKIFDIEDLKTLPPFPFPQKI